MIKMLKPNKEHKEQYIDMIKEWKSFGGPYVPCIIDFDCNHPIEELDYSGLLNVIDEYEKGIQEDKEYFEKSDFYFIFDDNKLIGAGEIRHNLTELGNETLGHIACGIRPSERQKGYATLATKEMINMIKENGVTEVVICHYSENIVSERMLKTLGFSFRNKIVSKVTGKEIKCYKKKLAL